MANEKQTDAAMDIKAADNAAKNVAEQTKTEQSIENNLSTVKAGKSDASDGCAKSHTNAETASVNDGEASTCAASGESCCGCAEKSASDGSCASEKDIERKYIALSFDDGPNTTTTVEVLDKLEKYGVVATFFVIGDLITDETVPVMKRAHAMGCEYANHSKTHSFMDKLTAEEIKAEVEYTDKMIFEAVGEHTHYFRPPYIVVNDTMFDNIDLPFICGCGAKDWEPPTSVEERAEGIISQMKNGAITLLHDMTGNEKTVQALDTIIPTLLEQGFTFVTVSDVFRLTGVKPKKHIVYSVTTQEGENA